MSTLDLSAFCQNLIRSKLLSEAEVAELRKQARADTPDRFANWLVQQGKLTQFQADGVLRGKLRFFLGDYKLLELVGSGRMAGVYRATHKLGMPVAVKILPPSRAKLPDSLARFQREAELALQLDHPHVVRTYHAGVADDLQYIAMEYLEGETLEEHLAAKGKVPPTEAVRIIQQALQGLQHLHDKGMVHRDLKPGNLMLAGKGPAYTVKLLDVGLGRALFDEDGLPNADLTAAGTVIGTPDYLAPEQARNSHAADVRSDLYSLGCVLYHCLAGRVPFPQKNAVEKIIKHSTEMPTPPELPGYPHAAALKEVLWKMIAKDPAMRYATPADALIALDLFLVVQVASPVRATAPVQPAPRAVPPVAPVAKPPLAVSVPAQSAPARDGRGNLRWVLFAVAGLLVVAIAMLVAVLAKK